MKKIEITTTSLLLAFLLACGGGSTTSGGEAAEPVPEGGAAEKTKADDLGPAEPGQVEDAEVPPGLSLTSLLRAGHASAATPTVVVSKAEADEVIERVFEMYEECAEGLRKASGDCDAVAASLLTWAKRHAPKFREMMPALLSLDKTMTEEREKELEKRMEPTGKIMGAALVPCMESKVLQAAMVELAKLFDMDEERDSDPKGAPK